MPYAVSATPSSMVTSVSAGLHGTVIAGIGAANTRRNRNNSSISNVQDAQWRKHNFGFFVQDTWKVTRKLTLDYGVRWDYQVAFQELYGRNSEFAPLTPNPSAGGLPGATQYEGHGPGRCNCSFTNAYPFALGPRPSVTLSPRFLWARDLNRTAPEQSNASDDRLYLS